MPIKMKKLKGGKVRVSTPSGVKAKRTTPAKAEAQARLLRGVEHGWKPIGMSEMRRAAKKRKKK